MPVSRRLRFEILRRDNHQCRYCGAAAPDAKLTVDHVTPVALGGSDDPSNLVTACADCNGGKTSIAPDTATVADVSADALRWTNALRQAAEEREAEYAQSKAAVDHFRKLWNAWTIAGKPHRLPLNCAPTVHRLLASGLTFTDFEELIEVAMTNSLIEGAEAKWKYFCGCCKKRLEQAHARAQQLAGGFDEEDSYENPTWTNQQIDHTWKLRSKEWREALGFDLPNCYCMCGPYCGNPTCRATLSECAHVILGGRGYLESAIGAFMPPPEGEFDSIDEESEAYGRALSSTLQRLERWQLDQEHQRRAEQIQGLDDPPGGAPWAFLARLGDVSAEEQLDAELTLLMPQVEKMFWQHAEAVGTVTQEGVTAIVLAAAINAPLKADFWADAEYFTRAMAEAAVEGNFDFAHVAGAVFRTLPTRAIELLPPFAKQYMQSITGVA